MVHSQENPGSATFIELQHITPLAYQVQRQRETEVWYLLCMYRLHNVLLSDHSLHQIAVIPRIKK